MVTKKTYTMGKKTVQALQDEHQPGLCLAEKGERTISNIILSLEIGFFIMYRVDLYNKSRMS